MGEGDLCLPRLRRAEFRLEPHQALWNESDWRNALLLARELEALEGKWRLYELIIPSMPWLSWLPTRVPRTGVRIWVSWVSIGSWFTWSDQEDELLPRDDDGVRQEWCKVVPSICFSWFSLFSSSDPTWKKLSVSLRLLDEWREFRTSFKVVISLRVGLSGL